MSGVLLHDTRRNIPEWTMEVVDTGAAGGLIINPFDSPSTSTSSPRRESATMRIERVRQAGGRTFFDPSTHALDFATDFTSYDSWNLWRDLDDRGNLSTDDARKDHVNKVFTIQDHLNVPFLAPTVEVQSASGGDAATALKLAEAAVALAAGEPLLLSIVGTEGFWSSAADLDDFVAMLSQHQPAGWLLTVVRAAADYPARVGPADVAGLCRVVRSLSAWGAEVIVAYGDLAGLPAVAAGARHLGTGWDIGQRVFARTSFQASLGTERAGWLQRPTYRGLLAALQRNEARTLADLDPELSRMLLPGELPTGPMGVGEQHFNVLGDLIGELTELSGVEARVRHLQALYGRAAVRLNMVQAAVSLQHRSRWITGCLDGLAEFARAEGLETG